jgi:predicted DNA-binding transcriptional regulator YafY
VVCAARFDRVTRGKSERLVNLTLALMAAPRYVTVEEIGRLVEGYDPPGGDTTDVAFRRMFERDKEELRRLGVPVETGQVDPLYGDDIGYRIRRADYALPPISLDADEAAALGLAARFWASAELADASASALRKLSAAGADPAPPRPGLEAHVDAGEPAFGPLTAAVRARRAVTFSYRRPGGEPAQRRLQPWGVISRGGHWYVAGHDLDREAERVFRLSRITGAVTPHGEADGYEIPTVDLRKAVADAAGDEPMHTARLQVTVAAGQRLLRRGTPDGPDLLVPYGSTGWFAGELAGYGADVLVLDPPELRDEVVALLRKAASR